jgi:hypothetical protein
MVIMVSCRVIENLTEILSCMKKFWKIPVAALAAFLLFSPDVVFAQGANSEQTVWKPVDRSLAELLDDGWQLINQSSTRAVTPFVYGPGPNPNFQGTDYKEFTFTLKKNGKYIICLISSPSATEASYSRCRAIN